MNPLQQQRLLAGNRSHRLLSGPGARLHRTAFGTGVRFAGGPADFSHPWLAELAGVSSAVILPGFINNVPAAIDGVPLAGTDKKPSPRLTWTKLQLNVDGIGYLAAEVTCDPANDWGITKVEMVQVADPDTEDGAPGKTMNATGAALPLKDHRARWPIAMIQRRASGLLEVFQITHFNLTHRVKLAANGTSAARHFFW